ncbi:FAD:protein FMN transferase [Paludisphaera borealis]|uniref:FAD:protein FMN transferase n=1 Tax=Paludisphaera borealis TaxID=1387353 RepID=A0A1U7CL02_9BACT|nr:FAD:protein FMN transferase [Paludisphaera borealis]APW59615.1 FAD:protein FMN transferase [Paludisphaera borealis]
MKAPRSGVNRRDLLRLRRMGAAISQPAAGLGGGEGASGLPDLVRVHRPGMGSYFEIRLGAKTPGAVELATRALDLVDRLEAQLTVYSEDSEVSRLNQTAHLGPLAVEPGLFALLEQACELSRSTGGAYDVTSGALSEAWGFVRGPKRVPTPEVLAEARSRTGWRQLRLDRNARTVAFDAPGLRINLGSIGKGYAIDRAVDVIRAHWFPTSALVHGGQSSVFALGSPPGRFAGRWEIALRNPFVPDSPLGVLRLRNRALGTSGGAFQRFEVDGRSYGHILDPRTGEPADGPASVTVLAPTSAEADALSTALFLLGAEAARELAARRPEIGVVIVEEGDADRSCRVMAFGLNEDDFTPA